jgi:hypothetical protein
MKKKTIIMIICGSFFFSQRDGTIEMNTITLFNTEKTLFKLGIPWNETTTGKYHILEHHNYKMNENSR